ncbi:ECF RNA polymerase sigma factor SigK [Actinoallomurus bryophytorum]|jgi:RNA polymerase sigma-70 factor, ECF subfamily|uniref:RNA polymerase sigma-70 factor (ECF subfamily) n=1 Tax=Actinoallomurus bryophytorum TaxID=1490222 RepID=A0A543CHT3_9ACTN|nr:sigma-70 family RNA polymerase sigma factor [Actinoallomurus bryophytorum]TQL96648.1 RNA polymerase sigma-70 factor (ECF subfamily) [Actinoallomurus bryophytorum]
MIGLEDGLELEELMGRVACGDGEAFKRVYAVVSGPVYGLVAQVLRDRVQCEQVTEEVLVELWQTAPRYEAAHDDVMGWVMSVAHRRAVDRRRADRGGHIGADGSDRGTAAARRLGQGTGEGDTRTEHQQVRHGWDTLTEMQREAVTLTYYAGHTYRQVAAHLNTSHDAIKTSLHDALMHLAAHRTAEIPSEDISQLA